MIEASKAPKKSEASKIAGRTRCMVSQGIFSPAQLYRASAAPHHQIKNAGSSTENLANGTDLSTLNHVSPPSPLSRKVPRLLSRPRIPFTEKKTVAARL